jgi:exosome complex component RRP43
MQHSAYSTTFALVNDKVLIDPTSQEEELSSASFSITYNTKEQLCGVQKPGGAIISPQTLHACMQVAKNRAHALAKQVDAVIGAQ